MTRGRTVMSVGEMRMEQADHGRDAKRENAMCAYGGCTASHGLTKGPKGYTGPYGGRMLCEKHYPDVVDELLHSLDETGHAPWEDE